MGIVFVNTGLFLFSPIYWLSFYVFVSFADERSPTSDDSLVYGRLVMKKRLGVWLMIQYRYGAKRGFLHIGGCARYTQIHEDWEGGRDEVGGWGGREGLT